MPDDPRWLQTILARPDDDGVRLQYASFLDQSGDPRAEFIRIQIELADIEGASRSPVHGYLGSKSDLLASRHGAEWSNGLAQLVSRYYFWRGFVEQVTIGARDFLERAPDLFARAPVRHLNLTGIRGVVGDVFASPYLRYIRSLGLQQNLLTDADIGELARSQNLTDLRWLSLFANRVGRDGAEALAASKNLPRLAYVDFGGNAVDPGQQYSSDQGYIASTWLPDEGSRLEERYGHLPWLHWQAETVSELPPSRYALSRAA